VEGSCGGAARGGAVGLGGRVGGEAKAQSGATGRAGRATGGQSHASVTFTYQIRSPLHSF
jgi:hypothetical protein